MKIKIQPNGKDLVKPSSSSKFFKFIKFLSNVYILPIEHKNDFKDVKFSLISVKTFISFIISSIPFLFTMVWWIIFQWDFASQYFHKSLNVYHSFDFFQMLIGHWIALVPFGIFGPLLWACYLWAYFPTLSQVEIERINYVFAFLAPTGAQGEGMSLCPYIHVCYIMLHSTLRMSISQ